jgi:hypothetical protein
MFRLLADENLNDALTLTYRAYERKA